MTDKTRVMVTGAAGQLGSAVVARLSGACDVFAFTRAALDLADAPAVLTAMTNCSPNFVINCAAYNDVEAAEDAAEAALSGNALAVQALARAAGATGATLIHYGTDFVFDGNADRPYVETDVCRPLSTYGMSKLLGEWFALEAPGAYVLRVESLFGGRPAKSSIDKIIAAIRAGQPVRVFADRTVTPSFVDDVAAATERIIHPAAARPAPGVYHCVNSGVTTWLGIAEEIARLLQRDAELIPVRSTEVKLKARRPVYCALSNEKLRAAGIEMPAWQEALGRYIGDSSAVGNR
jgi:dTDP-4-dehydrorhamnose reductase